MSNQAGGDAGNKWQRQLFVGQIPPQWKSDTLENYFKKSLRLEKADEEGWINIEWPKKTQTQKDKKNYAFVKFKAEEDHQVALDPKTFANLDVHLNIKESNDEADKRKLFFGMLSESITPADVIKLIETVCPGYEQLVEDDFPQVPEKTDGKPKIAFVSFKTHEQALHVKDKFNNLPVQKGSVLWEDLKKFSNGHSGTVQDLLDAVDYHDRTKKRTHRATSGSERKNSLIQDNRRYEFSWGNGKKIVIDDENQMIFFWGNGSNWKIIDKSHHRQPMGHSDAFYPRESGRLLATAMYMNYPERHSPRNRGAQHILRKNKSDTKFENAHQSGSSRHAKESPSAPNFQTNRY